MVPSYNHHALPEKTSIGQPVMERKSALERLKHGKERGHVHDVWEWFFLLKQASRLSFQGEVSGADRLGVKGRSGNDEGGWIMIWV